MARMRVALLFGGVSSEYEVSCRSAATVAAGLDDDKYEVFKIGITNKGRWLLYPGPVEHMVDATWDTYPDNTPAFLSPDRTTRGIVLSHEGSFDVLKVDVAFPVLHGRNGEDGTVQGLLEMAGIPYVGCDVLASAACMNKAFANRMFQFAGLAHTPWISAERGCLENFDDLLRRAEDGLKLPVFVKPAVGGSSVGVTKVKAWEDLRAAVLLACTHDREVVVEEAVDGMEIECAVLGNGGKDVVATLPGEIESCNETYDYEAKYESGDASRQHLPARLPQEKLEEVRDMAAKAYETLGCTGLSRVDFFVESKTGRVLINEINTMPGFTSISMYPKLMEMSGVPLPALCDRLVALALERAEG